MARRRAGFVLLAALALAAALLALRLDDVAGLYLDDGWYVLLAKALASGHGLTLINAPAPGIHSFYPPGFPALLAGIFLVAPDFPSNLPWLKLPGIASVLAVGALSWTYFQGVRGESAWRALLLALFALVHPAFVFLAASTVMSEPLFTAVQLAAILAAELAVLSSDRGRSLALAAVAGGLAAAANLVRSIALPLLPATVLYLAWRRGRGAALAAAAVMTLLVAPWLVHSRVHQPTPAEVELVNDQITVPYGVQFWMRVAGHPQHGWATVEGLPRRVAANLERFATRTVGSLLAYPLFRAIEPTDWRQPPGGAVLSLVLTTLVAAGLVRACRERVTLAEIQVAATLAVIIGFPYDSVRYSLPLLPFLALYLLRGGELLATPLARRLGGCPSNGSVARRARRAGGKERDPKAYPLRYVEGPATQPAGDASRVGVDDHYSDSLPGAGRRDGSRGEAAARRVAGWAAAALLGVLLIFDVALDVEPLVAAATSSAPYRTPWQRAFDENRAHLAWVAANLPPGAKIATQDPPLVYLYTGRKTVGFWESGVNLRRWRLAGVRYWVDCWFSARRFPDLGRGPFVVLHRSPRLRHAVVDLQRYDPRRSRGGRPGEARPPARDRSASDPGQHGSVARPRGATGRYRRRDPGLSERRARCGGRRSRRLMQPHALRPRTPNP